MYQFISSLCYPGSEADGAGHEKNNGRVEKAGKNQWQDSECALRQWRYIKRQVAGADVASLKQ